MKEFDLKFKRKLFQKNFSFLLNEESQKSEQNFCSLKKIEITEEFEQYLTGMNLNFLYLFFKAILFIY